jgi:hypothetical protein
VSGSTTSYSIIGRVSSFAWGYGGSGPAQLALAVLLKFTDSRTARENYQDFKWEIISQLDQADFEVEININPWLEPRAGKNITDANPDRKDSTDGPDFK